MNTTAWDRNPLIEFERFLQSPAFAQTAKRAAPPLSEASAEVYGFMFGRFVKWLHERGLKMSGVQPGDLREFLSTRDARGRPLHSKIAYRYLRLLERCYEHLAAAPNPASVAIALLAADRPARDREMVALSPTQANQVVAHKPELTSWKRRRDRAMQLVMLCAGLRVSEAIGLQTSEVAAGPEEDGTLRIRLTPAGKQPTSRPHETFLQAHAVGEVLDWLETRRRLGIPGRLAFPADEEGHPLHKSTVYRQARNALKEAGVALPHAGGRTLRNGFAVVELNAGTPEEAMRKRLGLVRPLALESYLSAARKQKAKPA
ncbi:tyrosine-type recombinase/integrase [Massilia sp. METH4]|uniref:tyrosine-type recombinase/integrase n=1 Tax=Massilia sp. METH4 TaxID=3123041 RepID=UPI0030CFC785